MLRTVDAVRYVTPFREGGSVPALVEADDDGLYVVKLRGAGQGAKALIAELVAGELARAAGLAVPELVLVELDAAFGRAEPDPELCLPLEQSAGLNLGLDYLPGSITFDPVAGPSPAGALASRIVLVDAFVANVDRTARNPNLLMWHRRLWLIDHGAALYFHHAWRADDPLEGSRDPFVESHDHVLLRWADALGDAAAHLAATFTPALFARIVAAIPESWEEGRDGFADASALRAAYLAWLTARVDALPVIIEEAERARASIV
jgi:hypothetical protein